jgi:sterol desaturase/sphingolipid hydroxylase (fatty acid hydroxylase superfamily)
MQEIIDIIAKAYKNYFNYIVKEITHPTWDNYFYALLFISLIVWLLEIIFPWRKQQALIRKDFWLDTFYMFFNFFILNLIILIALSDTVAHIANIILAKFNLQLSNIALINFTALPHWLGLTLFFIITDFVQWNTHRMLHKIPFFWNFHKVHHSVKEMGFAAHLRYHWMEPVVYKSLLYIPIALIGGVPATDVIFVHFIAITIGHLNHANIGWDYGILKYIFNNPKMHIWHHSKHIPNKNGSNFGISLSIWDYLFKTNYVPSDGKNNELGFEGDEKFPTQFLQQEAYPFIKK